MNYETVAQLIRSNNRIVILSGVGMLTDSCIPDFRSEGEAYKTEMEFDYSPEDLYSSVFFNTRPELFFRYYKKYVLFLDGKPNKGHFAVAELEKQGKLIGIITKSIYGLHQAAGAEKVMELYGSIHNNTCITCDKKVTADYIKNAVGIPTCEDCNGLIRPQVSLFGEMVDNGVITRASNAIEQADIAIIAGTNYHNEIGLMKYFEGRHIILINDEPHFSDDNADIVFYGHPIDILPKLVY